MKKHHLLFVIPVLLVLAFYSALDRIGWELPIPDIAAKYGFYMVSGLFGTLISFERTLILKNRLGLSIPLLSMTSATWALMGFSTLRFAIQALSALLLLRLYADYSGNSLLRKWMGLFQVIFILMFFASFAVLMLRENKLPHAE